MIRYWVAAVGLKAFSLNSATCSVYRRLGNVVGQKRRSQEAIDKYVERGNLLVAMANKYDLLKDGASLIELGTGWMHWFGLYLRLHAKGDIRLELYDVWDNRQLDALKGAFGKLADQWANDSSITAGQSERLNSILSARSFEELYARIGANYRIDNNGSLVSYPDSSFDAVFSFHVLEHVGATSIGDSIGHMYRMLKPGGYCIHQIGIDDHLTHYDHRESKKNYLRYSRALRKWIFENVVQYHNALQGDDFLGHFKRKGFDVISVDRERCNLMGLSIHADWKKYSQEDLETTILTVVCRRPG
jgi:SAM-dependent methyltransferase